MRLLLTHRRNLKRKFLDLENAIRHSLKAFGVRLSRIGRGGFAQAVRNAVAGDALTCELMEVMLNTRAALWKEYCRLHDLVVKFVVRNELCRRFMQIPGVGPVAALSFMTAIDDPHRFRRSRDVAAYFGRTSRRWQSGSSIDVQRRISKAGDTPTPTPSCAGITFAFSPPGRNRLSPSRATPFSAQAGVDRDRGPRRDDHRRCEGERRSLRNSRSAAIAAVTVSLTSLSLADWSKADGSVCQSRRDF